MGNCVSSGTGKAINTVQTGIAVEATNNCSEGGDHEDRMRNHNDGDLQRNKEPARTTTIRSSMTPAGYDIERQRLDHLLQISKTNLASISTGLTGSTETDIAALHRNVLEQGRILVEVAEALSSTTNRILTNHNERDIQNSVSSTDPVPSTSILPTPPPGGIATTNPVGTSTEEAAQQKCKKVDSAEVPSQTHSRRDSSESDHAARRDDQSMTKNDSHRSSNRRSRRSKNLSGAGKEIKNRIRNAVVPGAVRIESIDCDVNAEYETTEEAEDSHIRTKSSNLKGAGLKKDGDSQQAVQEAAVTIAEGQHTDYDQQISPSSLPVISATLVSERPIGFENCNIVQRACDEALGWDACKDGCVPGATFSCQCDTLKQVTTIEQYANWSIFLGRACPNVSFEIRAVTWDGTINTGMFFCILHATHTEPALFCSPTNDNTGSDRQNDDTEEIDSKPFKIIPPTGRTTHSEYVYIFRTNAEGKIIHMDKVWNDQYTFCELGWVS